MSENAAHSEIWPVPEEKLAEFIGLALELSSVSSISILFLDLEAGECYAAGSAEAELNEGEIAVEVTAPDNETYFGFQRLAVALLHTD